MHLKRIVLLFTLVVLLAGAAVYVLILREDHAGDPLDFLPGDTLALIDLRQPAAAYAQYRQSRLGQRLGAIRWGDLRRQFGASAEAAAAFQDAVDRFQAFLAGPVSRELFARRAVLALLPALPSATNTVSSAPWDSLVLIARPRHRPDVAELLAPLLARDSQAAMETYQGRDIRTFLLADNATLAVVASDGLLLASFSVDTVKRCLDLGLRQATAESGRLNSNPGYLAVRKRADGRDEQFVYGDVGRVTRLLYSVFSSGMGTAGPETLPDRFGHGAFFCGTEMGRLDCTAILQNEPGGPVAAIPPAVDHTLAVAPADLLLHYSTNLFDLPRVAAELQHSPPFQDAVGSAEEWFVGKTGRSLPDFLSLFGNRISLTVTGMRGNGFFPLPRLYGRLAVKDEERLRQALTALFAGKTQASKEVAGVRIHTLLLAGGLLQPSWIISDGFVLFADSPEQLEQSLLPPVAPLTESPRFKEVNVGLEAPNNMTTYVNYPRFLDGLQQLVAWTVTILTMMDQERGGQIKALVELVVTPVLDGMKMFAAGSSHLLLAPSELVMESALVFVDAAGEEK
ncbi:MAG: hypothetical protein ACYC9M_10950 [Desulfobulbaceae bacterium]